MVAFLVPLYTFGHHGLKSVHCDSNFDYDCYSFYRAIGSVLVTLTCGSLILMIHCRSYREHEWGLRGLKETLRDKTILFILLFDVVCCGVFLYVPNVAIKGFYMMGITWEWGLLLYVSY